MRCCDGEFVLDYESIEQNFVVNNERSGCEQQLDFMEQRFKISLYLLPPFSGTGLSNSCCKFLTSL
jgi:hypothetical protein